MRVRPFLAVAAAAALVATMPAHAKAPSYKTIDGKKVKTLTFTDATTAPQDHDQDFVAGSSDRTDCSQPRCAKFTFVYKPAKGVRNAPFSVKIAWTYPAEDYDLYVVQDNAGTVASCGAFEGNSEVAIVTAPAPGHKYTIVIDHYRSVPDTVTATVKFPTTEKVATTVPSAVDSKQTANCGLPATPAP